MSYRLVSTSLNNYFLLLKNEPDYVHALPMASTRLEQEVAQGEWLILAFAVWSILDLQAVAIAIEYAKKQTGNVQLGLRPFDRHDEMIQWVPALCLPSHDATTLK